MVLFTWSTKAKKSKAKKNCLWTWSYIFKSWKGKVWINSLFALNFWHMKYVLCVARLYSCVYWICFDKCNTHGALYVCVCVKQQHRLVSKYECMCFGYMNLYTLGGMMGGGGATNEFLIEYVYQMWTRENWGVTINISSQKLLLKVKLRVKHIENDFGCIDFWEKLVPDNEKFIASGVPIM